MMPIIEYPKCDADGCTNSGKWAHEGDFRCDYHVDIHPHRNLYMDINSASLYVDVVGSGEEQLDYPYAND